MEQYFINISNFISFIWNYLRSIIDILLVAFLFYWIYTFLVNTRAVQLLRGVVVIFIFVLVSGIFNLNTLEWIVKNLTPYLVFIIVLFQPELRRLISRFGQKNWFINDSKSESLQLDELVNAIFAMAEERIGSIIVIERNTGLRNFIESGVIVDAGISEELIRTIFFPLTPLHDGALIIQEGRIAGAACYLPLSDSKQMKKHHGSRHRAGLGIAEESDALVIVTSEERGEITIMVNGKMISGIKNNDLKNMILFFTNPKTAYEETYNI
jgi:diadenylate cyclase